MLKQLVWNQSEIKKHLPQSSFLHKVFWELKGIWVEIVYRKKKLEIFYYQLNENILYIS